jgi:hypothetical protein
LNHFPSCSAYRLHHHERTGKSGVFLKKHFSIISIVRVYAFAFMIPGFFLRFCRCGGSFFLNIKAVKKLALANVYCMYKRGGDVLAVVLAGTLHERPDLGGKKGGETFVDTVL